LQHIRNLFYNPEAFRPEQTAAQVTEEAAARFARLAEHLRKWGHAPDDIAHYLIRLLFCLFAEDIDLLPRDLFTRLVENGRRNPAHFNRQVRQLFRRWPMAAVLASTNCAISTAACSTMRPCSTWTAMA
jgi:hypothetical protein